MTTLAFCKPFQVMSQFSASGDKRTLAHFVDCPDVYPAGRLDYDSEGLMLLTDDGPLQHRLSSPQYKLEKTYWAQVEGELTAQALRQWSQGVILKDGLTRPARALHIDEPPLWPRDPPIRQRQQIPTSWLELTISEGKNRQVRRMTAALGFPTLRLIRARIGPIELNGLLPGQSRVLNVIAELTQFLQAPAQTTAAKPPQEPRRSPEHRPHPHKPNRRGTPSGRQKTR